MKREKKCRKKMWTFLNRNFRNFRTCPCRLTSRGNESGYRWTESSPQRAFAGSAATASIARAQSPKRNETHHNIFISPEPPPLFRPSPSLSFSDLFSLIEFQRLRGIPSPSTLPSLDKPSSKLRNRRILPFFSLPPARRRTPAPPHAPR